MVINSVAFKRKHNIPVSEGLSLKEIAKLSKMPEKALLEVKKRGYAAFSTSPGSVRSNVTSAEQWSYGRIFAFVMKTKSVYYGADNDIRLKYKLT
jgi:hypothetical protein